MTEEHDVLRVRMGRKPVTVVELDMDECSNRYGVLPCTASGATKCYNTFQTCQDRENFAKQVKTYRLTTDNAFLPVGDQVFPCIKEVNIAPTKLEMKGISLRASVTITCYDFPYHDRGLDPYWRERPEPQGTFWGKFKARNPFVVNRPIRINTSYIGDDGKVYGESHHYLLQSIDGPDADGRVVIKARDALSLADEAKAKAPIESSGKLVTDLAIDATIMPMYPTGIVNEYADAGLIRIGDEVIAYTGKTQNGLSGLLRGQLGTLAAEHKADDKVQQCLQYTHQKPVDILWDLLVNFANVPPELIDKEAWDEESITWLGLSNLTGLITQPTGVNKLIEEIQDSTGSVLWWDEVAKLIRFKVIQVPLPSEYPVQISDTDNLLKGSVKMTEKEQDRITRVSLYHHLTKASEEPKVANFSAVHISINDEMESEFAYNEKKNRDILSRWLESDTLSADVANRLLSRFERPNKEVTFLLDAKDATLRTGELADITARLTPNDDGSDGAVRVLVTERKEVVEGSHFQYVGYQTGNPGEVAALLAPDDEPDYPDGSSDYLYLTDEGGLIGGVEAGGRLC